MEPGSAFLAMKKSSDRPITTRLERSKGVYVAAVPSHTLTNRSQSLEYLQLCPVVAAAFVEYASSIEIATTCTGLEQALGEAIERGHRYLVRPRLIRDEHVASPTRHRLTRVLIDILDVPSGTPLDCTVISETADAGSTANRPVSEVLADPLKAYASLLYNG